MKTLKQLLIGILFLSTTLFAQQDPIATMTKFVGDVVIKRSMDEEFSSVKRGMFFYEGDRLVTYDDGKAEVFFSNGTIVHIGNDSELVFQADRKNKKKRSLFMVTGKSKSKVIPGTQFEVESVHGVAAVKGTEFSVDVDDIMIVQVFEGIVDVGNDKGNQLARKNDKVSLVKNGEPKLEKMNKKESQKAQEETNIEIPHLLTMTSPGIKKVNTPFKVEGHLKHKDTGKYAKGKHTITLKDELNQLELSNGGDYSNDIELTLVNGKGHFTAKGSAGQHDITVSGESFMGLSLPVTIAKLRREVSIKFDSAEGQKEITLEYERDE